MFKGRVDRVSHEGGLLVSYSGACPALGSVMVDSSETYIGKVDGVIGNLNDSLVHIAHLDRNSNATELVGVEIYLYAN
jgi:rRNA processing protein Gar1